LAAATLLKVAEGHLLEEIKLISFGLGSLFLLIIDLTLSCGNNGFKPPVLWGCGPDIVNGLFRGVLVRAELCVGWDTCMIKVNHCSGFISINYISRGG
jgi:hypothetical protein